MCDNKLCYRYDMLDSKMPYPNGEIFSPSTGRLANRKYKYVNCCEDENGVNICNKDLSKLTIKIKKNGIDINPNLHIPYGVTDVDVEYIE